MHTTTVRIPAASGLRFGYRVFLVASTHDGYKKSLRLEPHWTGRPPPAVWGLCTGSAPQPSQYHEVHPEISQGILHHACLCIHRCCPCGPARDCPPHVCCHGCEGKVHHRLSREPDRRGEVWVKCDNCLPVRSQCCCATQAMLCSSKVPGMYHCRCRGSKYVVYGDPSCSVMLSSCALGLPTNGGRLGVCSCTFQR